MKRRILVVEDDEHLAHGILLNLELEGYEAVGADSAEAGLDRLRAAEFDLVLLDVMLPGMDGCAVCREVRQRGDRVPILFLTARDRDEDRIRGLEEGGDDYLTKPFNLRELLARVMGIFRREDWLRTQAAGEVLRLGDVRVNLRTFAATTPAGEVALKEKEVLILRLLAERSGEPVDRATIIDRVWGYDAVPTRRTVDNFIVSLRKTLEPDPQRPRHLLTVHGVGYRLALEPDPESDLQS